MISQEINATATNNLKKSPKLVEGLSSSPKLDLRRPPKIPKERSILPANCSSLQHKHKHKKKSFHDNFSQPLWFLELYDSHGDEFKGNQKVKTSFVMARQNYKNPAYIGLTWHATTRFIVVLDIGAGSSFIKHSLISNELQKHIWPLDSQFSVWDASSWLVTIARTINLFFHRWDTICKRKLQLRQMLRDRGPFGLWFLRSPCWGPTSKETIHESAGSSPYQFLNDRKCAPKTCFPYQRTKYTLPAKASRIATYLRSKPFIFCNQSHKTV